MLQTYRFVAKNIPATDNTLLYMKAKCSREHAVGIAKALASSWGNIAVYQKIQGIWNHIGDNGNFS